MTDWEPATEVEAAMRDALRAGDQELYFRILARSELLLPVSSEALAGRAPVGWGTWTTNGRTHVLAFTSGDALRICLADNAGSARRMPYHDLASSWPNLEWWLAVNPGLPIEGYLPAWFVSQLARGDVRLPGRTMGARARLDRAESAARARARATVPGQVVQGEIVEPPFVDRAAAASGPVLEPDSIEPPQRNRPTRPPGFDSPIAASRRRGGVPPTDATPSSPATPPPYRQPLPPPQVTDATPSSPAAPAPYRQPLPPPQVTDATPYPQRPTDNGYGRQPAPNSEAAAWPPPVVRGEQPPPAPSRPAPEPREVTDRPSPTMRPRSPFREDPARSSPPARFGEAPRPPRPLARPTSGGGFFGSDQPDPPAHQPPREDRPAAWSPANGTPAPNEGAPWPQAGATPGWPDGVAASGRATPAWPSAAASAPAVSPAETPQPPAQSWPARSALPGESDIPGTRSPRSWAEGQGAAPSPRWSDRGQAGSPLPSRASSESSASATAQPWPGERTAGDASPQGTAPAAQPRPGQATASGAAAANLWSAGSAGGPPSLPSAGTASPQSWVDRAAATDAEPAGPPASGSVAPQPPSPVGEARAGATSGSSPTDSWTSRQPSRPASDQQVGAGAGPTAPRATDLWAQRKPAGAGEQSIPGAPGPRATDLWSSAGTDGQTTPAGPGSAPADMWSERQPSNGAPRGGQAPGQGQAPSDLWAVQQAPPHAASSPAAAGDSKPSSADLWSGDKPATSDEWSGRPAAPTTAGSAAAGQPDPASGGRETPSATDDRGGQPSRRATDLWASRQPSRGSAKVEDRSNAAQSSAHQTDLWPGRSTGSTSPDGQANEAAPAQSPVVSNAGGSAPDRSNPDSAAGRGTDLWSDRGDPQGRTDVAGGGLAAGGGERSGSNADATGQSAGNSAAGRGADLWSDRAEQAGDPQARADAAGRGLAAGGPERSVSSADVTDGRPADGAAGRGADLWSDRAEQAGDPQARADAATDGQASGGSATGHGTDLWSDRAESADNQAGRAPAGEVVAGRAERPGEADAADRRPLDEPASDAGGANGDRELAAGPEDRWSATGSWSDRSTDVAASAAAVDMTPAAASGQAPTDGSDHPSAGWASTWADRTPTTGTATPSWLDQPQPQRQDTVFTAGAGPVPADFRPANDVEESLLNAAGDGSTDTFLSTLLLARVLLPVSPDSKPGAQPGSDGFVWRTETIDDEPYVVVFTSPERMAEHVDKIHDTVMVKFVKLINSWPQEDWSFAVNPGTPVGAKLPGAQIVALASWAADVGLDASDDEPVAAAAPRQEAPAPAPEPKAVDPALPTMMQKTIAPSQVDYYLERGYDRVSGFVHRVSEVAHLRTPAQLFTALGLGYANSPFAADADEVYVLRWPAYRPSLYRIPYGGPNESAMRAMEGWVIERAPFRGNGFAPGEGTDVIAEFKVDSARLPHGAQLWLVRRDGSEQVVATLDADAPSWNRDGAK
ncbi:hypothetical protein GCM10009687_09070 [Asanoa iriomotensis]